MGKVDTYLQLESMKVSLMLDHSMVKEPLNMLIIESILEIGKTVLLQDKEFSHGLTEIGMKVSI